MTATNQNGVVTQLGFDEFYKLAAELASREMGAHMKTASDGVNTAHPTGSMEHPDSHPVSGVVSGKELDKDLKDNAGTNPVNDAPANQAKADSDLAKTQTVVAETPKDTPTGESNVSTTPYDPGTALTEVKAACEKMSDDALWEAWTKGANTILAGIIASGQNDATKTAKAATSAVANTNPTAAAAATGYADAAAAAPAQHTEKFAADVAEAEQLIELGITGGDLVVEHIKRAVQMAKAAEADPAMMDPAAAGGAPPMDPAAMGGAPPMDPAAAGGAPPMDPAAGGAPGGDGGAGGDMSPDQLVAEFLAAMAEMGMQPEEVKEKIDQLVPESSPEPPAEAPPEEKAAVAGLRRAREFAKSAAALRRTGTWGLQAPVNNKRAQVRSSFRQFLAELCKA